MELLYHSVNGILRTIPYHGRVQRHIYSMVLVVCFTIPYLPYHMVDHYGGHFERNMMTSQVLTCRDYESGVLSQCRLLRKHNPLTCTVYLVQFYDAFSFVYSLSFVGFSGCPPVSFVHPSSYSSICPDLRQMGRTLSFPCPFTTQ